MKSQCSKEITTTIISSKRCVNTNFVEILHTINVNIVQYGMKYDIHNHCKSQAVKSFKKYPSATCYFSRPYNEKNRAEFEECIGTETYRACIRCFKVRSLISIRVILNRCILSYIFIWLCIFQVLEACCFVPVTSNAFTLQMEDGITSIYFAKNERQRTEFFELMSKLPS